ncbi:MAG: tetratricopeptide repeat protein, partial [Pseudomonadota bacterium]
NKQHNVYFRDDALFRLAICYKNLGNIRRARELVGQLPSDATSFIGSELVGVEGILKPKQ